ncbi:MAG TPA: peptidoglycan-binding domain-containing protein [Gammaproteobacteria bacterium]|nr:peptidoglycan-binding domain-containing protein [Gammaproteobacteria bacterium]
MIIKKSINTALICIATTLISSGAYADDHHGHYHDHHDGGDVGFGLYFGSGAGPYYPYGYGPYGYGPYGYGPYYPSGTYVVIDGDGRGYSSHHASSVQPSVTVMKAQVVLYEQGFYKGSIDGVYGAQTQAALKVYQKTNDLPETGLLDDATLKKMGVPKSK